MSYAARGRAGLRFMRLAIILCSLFLWQAEEYPAPEGWRRVTSTEASHVYLALRPPVRFAGVTFGTGERIEPKTDTPAGQRERKEAMTRLARGSHGISSPRAPAPRRRGQGTAPGPNSARARKPLRR